MIHNAIQKRRLLREGQILDEALAIIVESGLGGLTVARLSKRMGWTVGAMYRYFSGKDQLIATLNARILVDWTVRSDALLATQTDGSALERLAAVLDLWIQLAHERPAEFGLISLTLADPRNLVEDVADAVHVPAMLALLSRVTDLLLAAAESGALTANDDPFGRALQLVFACHGVLQLRKLERFDAVAFDTRTLAGRTVHDLLTAWEAP
jgi:AcrR family transcriptional regulator